MADMEETHGVKHLIVDSAAFIRNLSLKDIGDEMYTVSGVIEEIRDKATRERLQVLAYQLHIKEPQPDCIQIVTEFAKKTGDFHSLSKVDIRLMALVYQLHRQHCGLEGIRTQPINRLILAGHGNAASSNNSSQSAIGETRCSTESSVVEVETEVVDRNDRFIIPSSSKDESKSVEIKFDTDIEALSSLALTDSLTTTVTSYTQISNDDSQQKTNNCIATVTPDDIKTKQNEDEQQHQDEGESNEEDYTDEEEEVEEDEGHVSDDKDEEDDDGEGWITPSNLSSLRHTLDERQKTSKPVDVPVACITMDFAMQNVLLQMGLHVLSLDGLLIKRTNCYVLRCHACFKISTDTSRQFCHKCGNNTLKKVAMSVDADGTVQYHISQRKKLSTRGLRYSLPMPKGGKQASNPILCEDQLRSQRQKQASKSKLKYEALSEDYIAHASPFAPTDISSRAAIHRFTDRNNLHNRRNPNENSKVYGRRK